MTDAVVTSFTARFVVVDGGTYSIESANMTFSGTGMNTMSVVIAVGISDPAVFPGIFFSRGQEARLLITDGRIISRTNNDVYGSLFPNALDLFRGVIQDFGPVQLSPGVFALQVIVHGRALWLASDSLNAAGIKANNYTDTTAIYGGAFDGVLPPYQLDLPQFQADAALAFKTAFLSIANALSNPASADAYLAPGSVAEKITLFFGGDANSEAVQVLTDLTGSLIWRDMSTNQGNLDATARVVDAIFERINEALTYDWSGETYYSRYQNLGSVLYFRLIEVSADIRVVPYTPFFRSSDAYPILPNTYASVRWVSQGSASCRGVALTAGQGTDVEADALILGMYQMRGSPTGAVYVMEAPSILMSNNVPNNIQSDTGEAARSVTAAIGDLGAVFAKFYTWANNYQSRELEVSCPTLRTDIGPLEAVRIDFPVTPDIVANVGTIAMYGSVMSVSIALDASRGTAVTSYRVGFVRSYEQQTAEIDPDLGDNEHPFFTSNYIGGRLDTSTPRRA